MVPSLGFTLEAPEELLEKNTNAQIPSQSNYTRISGDGPDVCVRMCVCVCSTFPEDFDVYLVLITTEIK